MIPCGPHIPVVQLVPCLSTSVSLWVQMWVLELLDWLHATKKQQAQGQLQHLQQQYMNHANTQFIQEQAAHPMPPAGIAFRLVPIINPANEPLTPAEQINRRDISNCRQQLTTRSCLPLCAPVCPCVPLCAPVCPCVPLWALCAPVCPCVPLCTTV